MGVVKEVRNKAQQSKKHGFFAIVGLILVAAMIFVIAMNLILIVKAFTDDEHIPSVFGFSPVIVLSGSMSPEFETNSMIFIIDVDADKLEAGDVICFLQDGTAVTHRIVNIVMVDGERNFVTQGDANDSVDVLAVTTSQIEGKYIGNIPVLGGIALFMQTTTGMILFVGVPVVIYLVVDLLIRKKEAKEEKKKMQRMQAELQNLKNKDGE